MASDPKQPRAAKLTVGSIRRHLVTQTAPMIVGIAAVVSVGIIDAYFIGQLGKSELAAVGFIFPVTQALASLGVGVMAGLASVVSRALGRGEDDFAEGLANLGFVLGAGVGLFLGITLFLGREPLFELMQAEQHLLPLIDQYMAPYALGFAALPALMALNGALRAQGAAGRSMAILIVMAAVNWILDPLLITGAFGIEGFGIAGAAYATVASWAAAAITGFALLQTSDIRFVPATIARCELGRDSWALGRVSAPAAFANSVNPFGLSILTAFVASAGEDAVAAFGAGGRVQSFAIVPLLGLSSSIGAIVGQNWGARQFDRARRALLWSGGFSLVYGLLVATALVFTREPIAAIFSDAAVVKGELARYLLISSWGWAGFGIFIVVNGALNAIDRAGTAMLQSVGRVVVVMVPVAWILRGPWGAEGVYAGELAANVVTGFVAAAIAWRVLKSAETSAANPSA